MVYDWRLSLQPPVSHFSAGEFNLYFLSSNI
jgi:hypothetical protein